MLVDVHDRTGSGPDLDAAIAHLRDTIDTVGGHPRRDAWSANLAHVLLVRFERLGPLTDLDEAVGLFDAAVSRTAYPTSRRRRPCHVSAAPEPRRHSDTDTGCVGIVMIWNDR